MMKHGYEKYGKVIWLKCSSHLIPVNFIGKLQRHSTETLLIFKKGDIKSFTKFHSMNDVLVAPFTGQSEKPESMYDAINQLVPSGFFLEVFARQRNLRTNYVSIGNQLRKRSLKKNVLTN
jgi:N6-adenosine-specific RNA methylase IME4